MSEKLKVTAEDIGKEVILDADYHNSSLVKLESIGVIMAEVSSCGRIWTVMLNRLSRAVDL